MNESEAEEIRRRVAAMDEVMDEEGYCRFLKQQNPDDPGPHRCSLPAEHDGPHYLSCSGCGPDVAQYVEQEFE